MSAVGNALQDRRRGRDERREFDLVMGGSDALHDPAEVALIRRNLHRRSPTRSGHAEGSTPDADSRTPVRPPIDQRETWKPDPAIAVIEARA